MALKKIPYASVTLLIRDYLSTEEWAETALVMKQLRPVKARGYFTPADLEVVCRWKSPRALHYIRGNTAAEVRRLTKQALTTRSERRRLEALTSLRGVSVPMASAILTLLQPHRYGVIDIRVWQLLHAVGAVTKKSSGVGFDFNHWYQFLTIIRSLAATHGVRARDVERALFHAHRDYQKGVLYAGKRG